MVYILPRLATQDHATRISSFPSWHLHQSSCAQICRPAGVLRVFDEHTQAQRMALHFICHTDIQHHSPCRHSQTVREVKVKSAANARADVLTFLLRCQSRQMNRKLSRRVFRLVCGTSLAFTLVATVISTFNYPGAHTLLRLNNLLREEGATPQDTTVHLNAYSRMNGISDMVHNPSLARISKDESLTDAGQYTVFDYIVTHEPQLHSKAFNVVQGIKGWAGVRSQIPSLKKALTRRDWRFFLPAQSEGVPHYLSRVLPLQPRIEELVWIMRNKKRRSKENV